MLIPVREGLLRRHGASSRRAMTSHRHETGADGAAEYREEDFITLEQLVGFLRRYALRVVMVAVAAGLTAALLLVLLSPPRYQARATFMIAATSWSRELAVPSPGAQGYQRILESDAVLQETARRLKVRGALAPSEHLSKPHDLKTRVFQASGAGLGLEAPILELMVQANDPVMAAEICNLWAEVFLERLAQVATEATSGRIRLVRSRYQRLEEELASLEREFEEQASRFKSRVERASERSQARTATLRRRTAELVAEYGRETGRLFDQMERDAQGDGAGVEGSPGTTSLALRMRILREQLAKTQRFLFLESAVDESAFWQDEIQTDGEAASEGPVRTNYLRQEPNPLYEALFVEIAEVEAQLRAEADGGGRTDNFLRAQEDLQRSRTSGLTALMEDRIEALAALRREEAAALRAIAHDRDLALARLVRAIDRKRELLELKAEELDAANLAGDLPGSLEVQLVSEAVPPFEPIPRRIALKVGTAVFFGGLLGLTWGLAREASRTRRAAA